MKRRSWYHWTLVAAALAAITLTFFSLFRVGFSPGLQISFRQRATWQSTETSVVQTASPDPHPSQIPKDPAVAVTRAMRAERLDHLYASLASTPVVRALVLKNGPLHGAYKVTTGMTGGLLPSLSIEGRAASPARATQIAARVSRTLQAYIKQQQTAARIPQSKRVHLTVLSAAGEPERIQGHLRKSPLFALGGVMALLLLAARITSDGRPSRKTAHVESHAHAPLRPPTSKTTMREYELEVNEEDGRTTRATISTDDWYTVGDVFEDDGRALRVWRIEQAEPPCAARLICDPYNWETFLAETEAPLARRRRARRLLATPEDPAETEEPSVIAEVDERHITIEVSPEAAERIRSKGGTLYLWEKPIGSFVQDKAGFEAPNDPRLQFDPYESNGVRILIADHVELPETLSVTRAFWPPLKLQIKCDSKIWGRRGIGTEVGGGGGT